MEANKTPEIRFKGFSAAWEQRKLGEFGSVAMCKRIYKEQTSEQGDVPFFKIGTFGTNPDAFISNELFEYFKRTYPYPTPGTLLISAAGSIGRVVEYQGEKAYFQDSNIVWLEHDHRLNDMFLKPLYSQIEWGLEGSTIKRLYNKDLLSAEVTIPGSGEQKEIGRFFAKLDDLITLHQRKCDKLVKLKSAMLDRMFPKPGDSEPEIRFATFKEPWGRYKLGDVAAIARGERFTASDYVESGGIPCIHYGEIYTSYGTIATKTISQVSSSLKDSLRYAKQGDVIVAATSENVEDVCKAVVWMGNSPVAYHDDSFALTFSGDPIFLVSFFETSEFFAHKSSTAHGVKVMRVSSDSLADVDLPLPSAAEQRLIGGYFAKLDNLITLHQRKLEGLRRLKTALLNKMFV